MVKHRKALLLPSTVTKTYDPNSESLTEMMDIDFGDNGWQDAVGDGVYVDPSVDKLGNYHPFQTVNPTNESSTGITEDSYDDSTSCLGGRWRTLVYENAGIETYLKHFKSRAAFGGGRCHRTSETRVKNILALRQH